jgi:ketosteroid isomerase-like protein
VTVLVAATVALVVVAGGILAAVLVARSHSDEAQIRRLVARFAVAVDREDQHGVIQLLCAEEAADVTEDDDYDAADDGGLTSPPPARAVRTTQVVVTGRVAHAQITRPSQTAATLWFRKEDDRWTVCAHAADQASPTPGGTG